jgi:hypothetical protein
MKTVVVFTAGLLGLGLWMAVPTQVGAYPPAGGEGINHFSDGIDLGGCCCRGNRHYTMNPTPVAGGGHLETDPKVIDGAHSGAEGPHRPAGPNAQGGKHGRGAAPEKGGSELGKGQGHGKGKGLKDEKAGHKPEECHGAARIGAQATRQVHGVESKNRNAGGGPIGPSGSIGSQGRSNLSGGHGAAGVGALGQKKQIRPRFW